jgi:superoxide dismutase, Fe-Mn family
LFWENLIPPKSYEEPSGSLAKDISSKYGSLDKFQTTFNAALAGIQGSGWGWLVKKDGELAIVTTPVLSPQRVPI